MSKLQSNKKLKLFATFIILFVLTITAFYLKNKIEIQRLPSTDLSCISIEGIQLNDNVANIDLSKFKRNLDFNNQKDENLNYNYFGSFNMITNQDGMVVQLKTSIPESNALINNHQIKTLTDVKQLLGTDYVTRSYDRDQGLISNIYYDKDRKMLAKFIYPKTKNVDRPYMMISIETY